MIRVSKWLLVLTLVLSLGAHWALLQTVAWTGMVIRYSQDGSFGEALSKTFDGKHPCGLCKMIQKGRAEEKKQDQQQVKTSLKPDCGLVWQTTTFDFSCDRERITSPDAEAFSRSEEPPKPRPRHFSSDNPA